MNYSSISVAVATAAMFGLAGCASLQTNGQGGSEPLVGAWDAEVTLLDCASGQPNGAPPFRALVMFHAGGTLTEVSGPSVRRTPSLGTWSRAGKNEYTANSFLLTYAADGAPTGAQEIGRTIRLTPDANGFAAETRTVATDPGGAVTFRGCARGVASRVETRHRPSR